MLKKISKVLLVGVMMAASDAGMASATAPPSLGLQEIVDGMHNVNFFKHVVEQAGGWEGFGSLRNVTLLVPDDDACRVADAGGKSIAIHTSVEARDFVLKHVFKGQINLQSTDRPKALAIIEGEHVMAHWVDPNGPVQSVVDGQSTMVPSEAGGSSQLRVENGNAYVGSSRIRGSSGYVGAGVTAYVVDGCNL